MAPPNKLSLIGFIVRYPSIANSVVRHHGSLGAAPGGRKHNPCDRTARLESLVAAAWARENARITAREASEKARRDRQAAEEREVAADYAEAEAITQSLQARLTELETLLASMLGEDPYLPF